MRYEDPTVVTISQRKWQSPGIARKRTVSPTKYTPRKCPRNNPLWEWRARDTQESVKLTKRSPWIQVECRTVKHKTPTGAPTAPGKRAEINQVRCKAILVEPPQPPKGPDGTNARGDAPSQKRNAHQWRKPSGKTRSKRGDNATGSNNETDAKKQWRARSGQS